MERPELTPDQQAIFTVLVHLRDQHESDRRAVNKARVDLRMAEKHFSLSEARYDAMVVHLQRQYPDVDWSDQLLWESVG